MYALATAVVTPKLLIHVFIGSRLAIIARSGGEMSTGAKALNWCSVIAGGLVGVTVGWYIYRKTMGRAQELEAEQVDHVREDHVRRSGPLSSRFTDDPEANLAAEASTQQEREDDELEYFDQQSSPPGGGGAIQEHANGYRDEEANNAKGMDSADDDDDDDVFGRGDGDGDADAGRRL